jgi:hypothetical protein
MPFLRRWINGFSEFEMLRVHCPMISVAASLSKIAAVSARLIQTSIVWQIIRLGGL